MPDPEPSFAVSRADRHVALIEADLGRGEDFWVLVTSDRHHDNACCDRALELDHLRQARERGAAIFDNGDLFCAMQGKWDPRSSQAQTPDSLKVDDYSDRLVAEAAEFYSPFARNFAVLAQGNHEDAINRRCQTNLTRRLVRELAHAADGHVPLDMAYQGWVQFRLRWGGGSHSASKKLRFTHGYGGGGPVTKDTIQANRQLVYTEDCDVLLSGHTHDAWHLLQRRQVLTDEGKTRLRTVHCLKCPGYKDEFSDSAGWAVGKGHGPKPLGAWWLRFYARQDKLRFEVTYAD